MRKLWNARGASPGRRACSAGISSGTNVAAALRLARVLGPGKTVVTLAPDTGERYFSTVLFEGE